jgi:hypothetical protein
MSNYLYLPGAGSYPSVAEVNLLDADSAHLQQSTGQWSVGALSSTYALFGDNSLKVTGGVDTVLTPGTDAAMFSCYVYSEAGATFTVNGGAGVAVPAATWTQLSDAGPDGTYTVACSTAEDYWVDQACVRAGADPAFVPSLRIVGDLEMEYKHTPREWKTNRRAYLARSSQYATYDFDASTGKIRLQLISDAGSHFYDSVVLTDIVNGTPVTVRSEIDWATSEWKLYLDDVLKDTISITSGTKLAGGANDVSFNSGVLGAVGDLYWMRIRDGIGGPLVLDADFTDLTKAEVEAASFDTDYHTVTLNGDAWAYVEPYAGGDVLARAELLLDASNQYVAGSPLWPDLSGNDHHAQYGSAAGADTNDPTFVADDGTHPAWFTLTTDDYFEIADHANLDFAANESLTLLVIGQTDDVSPVADQILAAKKDNLTTSAGYALYLEAADDSAKFLIGDSAADDEDATPNLVASTLFTVAGVRDTTADDIEAFLDGTGSGSPVTDSTTLTIANALPLRIGATSNVASSFFEGVIAAVVLWREALTDTEIAAAGELLLGDTPKMLLLGVG